MAVKAQVLWAGSGKRDYQNPTPLLPGEKNGLPLDAL
jgi:hypothetical protein